MSDEKKPMWATIVEGSDPQHVEAAFLKLDMDLFPERLVKRLQNPRPAEPLDADAKALVRGKFVLCVMSMEHWDKLTNK